MEDRSVFRIGAWAAIVGGVLAILVNVFAPRTSGDDLGNLSAFVDLAARSDGWELIQIGVVVAVVIILAAFYAISRSIDDPPARAWARLGLGAALVGSTIGAAAFSIGAGLGATSAGTEVLEPAAFVYGRLFNTWVLTYFGLTALLYGIALIQSVQYPTWLGSVTVFAGVVGLVSGFIDAFTGASALSSFVLFPISSGVTTLVILYLGVLLFRKASA